MTGKLARRILHVVERDRVRERQRRHVAERVRDQQRIERAPIASASTRATSAPPPTRCRTASSFSRAKNRSATIPMKNGDTQRRDGRRAVGEPDLRAGEPQRLAEVRPHRDEPRSPDEVLEEHHHRAACARGRLVIGSCAGSGCCGTPAHRAWSPWMRDVAALRLAVVRPVVELARLDLRLPVGAPHARTPRPSRR